MGINTGQTPPPIDLSKKYDHYDVHGFGVNSLQVVLDYNPKDQWTGIRVVGQAARNSFDPGSIELDASKRYVLVDINAVGGPSDDFFLLKTNNDQIKIQPNFLHITNYFGNSGDDWFYSPDNFIPKVIHRIFGGDGKDKIEINTSIRNVDIDGDDSLIHITNKNGNSKNAILFVPSEMETIIFTDAVLSVPQLRKYMEALK